MKISVETIRTFLAEAFKRLKASKDYVAFENEFDDKALSPRRPIIFGLVTVSIFFGGFGAWASLAKMDGAIIAPGNIKVEQHRKDVQHYEGGIVDRIHVRNGDFVEKGQVLVTLRSATIDANVDLLRGQYYTLLARKSRLEAERQMSETISWPEVIAPGTNNQQAADVRQAEQQIFDSGRKAFEGQISLLRQQKRQIEEQVKGLWERLDSEEKIIEILEEELEAKKALVEERYIEKTPVLALRRSHAEHVGMRGAIRGDIAKSRERAAELDVRMNEIETAYVEEAVSELSDVKNKVFDIEDRLRPQVDAKDRLQIRAAVSGTIVDMKVFSESGVIKPGETIMQIVPEEEPLVIECIVRPQDIAKTYKDQAARVQLNAFNTRELQPIDGTVTYVSADSIAVRTPYGEQQVYKIHVALNNAQVEQEDLTLSPGMPATVFLNTGERTFLDYILEPLIVNIRQALRE